MTQLPQGLYDPYDPHYPSMCLFGLRWGQGRDSANRVVRNAGWYNKAGEWLGWGDLSVDDFQAIAAGLQEGELFIVLCEYDRPEVGDPSVTEDIKKVPGPDYVAEHATYVIGSGTIYRVDSLGHFADRDEVCLHSCSMATVTNPQSLRTLMAEPNAVPR